MRYIWLGYVVLFWVSGCAINTTYDTAYDAYQEKDFVTAAQEFRLLADQGNASAQEMLGLLYNKGEGVVKDNTEAARWFRKAADQGIASAQYNLGLLYIYGGEGVVKDATEAARWFRKAADQGIAAAQNNLGALYIHGEGVVKDATEAARWFRKAADQGQPTPGIGWRPLESSRDPQCPTPTRSSRNPLRSQSPLLLRLH